MPISQLSPALQKIIMFLPGTYGTALLKRHCMRGAFEKIAECGIPEEAIDAMRDSIDFNLYFFDTQVSEFAMYTVLTGSIVVLIGIYIILNVKKKANK